MEKLTAPAGDQVTSPERTEPTAVRALEGPNAKENREDPRYAVVKPVVAIPLLPGGLLDWDHHVEGFSWDLSYGGIALNLDARGALRSKDLLIALDDGSSWCYAGMRVSYSQQTDASALRVGGPFAGRAHEILTPTNLIPSLDRQTMQFTFPVEQRILDNWAKLGILQPTVIDRVELCPKCEGLPTFRQGCPACGSAWIEQEQLIHHFACAHVAKVGDFEQQGELVCPKCRTRALIVGSDFEYLWGSYHCLHCQHSDTSLQRIAECLRCGHRFSGDQVVNHELIGYHANPLDPMSLLSEP